MINASIEVDAELLDSLQQQIRFIESRITAQAREHDAVRVALLRTIPGIGKTLALTILYEIGDISLFPRVGNFTPYARWSSVCMNRQQFPASIRISLPLTANRPAEAWQMTW